MNLNNCKRLKEDICVFENFLTEEESKSIVDYWNFCKENDLLEWTPISFYESYASVLPENEHMEKFNLPKNFFTELETKMQEATAITRKLPVKKVSYHAQQWEPGAFAGFHSDNSTNGVYNAFERSKWAAFLYLNDDYQGGELDFKDHEITIKPKAGMLAAFAGGAHNEHQVTQVIGGNRYTIGSFWDNEEAEYSEEKVASWEKEIAEERLRQADQIKGWQEKKAEGIILDPSTY